MPVIRAAPFTDPMGDALMASSTAPATALSYPALSVWIMNRTLPVIQTDYKNFAEDFVSGPESMPLHVRTTMTRVENEMDDYTLAIAGILRKAAADSGLTYDQISERSGLSRPTVARVLTGQRDITTRYLRALCRVFDLNPSRVLDEADEANASI